VRALFCRYPLADTPKSLDQDPRWPPSHSALQLQERLVAPDQPVRIVVVLDLVRQVASLCAALSENAFAPVPDIIWVGSWR
jgi:hypothetical protein